MDGRVLAMENLKEVLEELRSTSVVECQMIGDELVRLGIIDAEDIGERRRLLPKKPPEKLLWSIAVRWNHALGIGEELYDSQFGKKPGDWQRERDSLMREARRAYEEIAGDGFYVWDRKDLDATE